MKELPTLPMPLCMSKPQFKPHKASSECRMMSCQLVKHFYKWSWLKALNLISNLCIHFITFVSVLFFVLHERIFSSCYMNQNEFITAALLDGRQGCRHVFIKYRILITRNTVRNISMDRIVLWMLCSSTNFCEGCVYIFPSSYMFSTRTRWKPTSPVKLISKH